MQLLQDQLAYDPAFSSALERMAKFLALVYVPAWLSAPLTTDAPYNDASLLNQLQAYKLVDDQVASAAMKVVKRHTWYLAPETAIFALCSDKVGESEKSAMAEKLLATPRPDEHVVGGNVPVVISDEGVKLHELVDEDSWMVFNILEMKGEWLNDEPAKWIDSDEYRLMCDFVSGLRVTNDTAERGVQLVQQFSRTLTSKEGDMQWLLQCVEAHRRKIPNFSKGALNRQ